jgi:hypothetical protein
VDSCYLARVRSPALAIALGALALGLTAVTPARADVSGWAFLGGGAVAWKQPDAFPPLALPATKADLGVQGALTFDVGVGTSPDGPVIVGGLFRLMPFIGHGTDLALLGRIATRGFQQGSFGLALDAGGYARFWGNQSSGFLGELVLGAPLGFELRLLGSKGTGDAIAYGAIAGVDVLRLTVFRQVFLDWWQNPSPTLREATTAPTTAIRYW